MKRKEEITKKALELDTTNDIATFVVAAQWADKTMIDKACKYLKNALYEVASGVTNSFDIMSIENTTMDDFISSFRKAMEE